MYYLDFIDGVVYSKVPQLRPPSGLQLKGLT